MGRVRVRTWFVVFVFAVALTAGGIAIASVRSHRRPGLSVAKVLADNARTRVRVIVLLRNQHLNLPPTRRLIHARMTALRSDQAPLESLVRRAGGRITDSYRTFNAFAAILSRSERSRLAANPSVAEILPDAYVPAPDPTGAPTGSAATGKASSATGKGSSASESPATGATANGGQAICPSNPADPLVQPEGLSLIQATQAQQIVDGSGVKVGIIADGLDVGNPDFIRADGSHVITDYEDFTGGGPGAPTSGAEAFGDASTIAAQGNVVYDLSKFVNPAHPLPTGCNIVLHGVAPGVSLDVMDVFPQNSGAFTSMLLQGMDWAVSVDHVNVLNESFGSDNIPDTDQDATKQFNRLAVAAGVVVTVSSGDQGTANTIGSPASDPSNPGALSVGATTQFQHMAQTDRGGYQLSPNGWVDDNIAEFSSSGFSQEGGTLDLVAPGNESYEACTANTTQYSDCTNFAAQPSNLSTFGGTSESAPMTAGVAALVIEAYRNTHGGASPSPELVKQLITSNADDLNIPSDEEGAGELDALAAVQAAESVGSSTPTGDGRLVSPSQLDLAVPAGAPAGAAVHLTNVGAAPETYTARLRTLTTQLSDDHGDVTLDPASDQTFVDNKGVPQAYTELHFTVPAGADRLDASISYPGPTSTVNLVLFDPSGQYTAYTYQPPGGGSDFGHISARNPAPGTWTAAFFTPDDGTGFSGAVHYDLSTSSFGSVGSVTPSSVTLSPGASTWLHVALTAPSAPGDYSRDLQLSDGSGKTSVVPIVLRSLVPLSGGRGNFAGTITGGDGDGLIGRDDTFAFDVPAGAPALNVQVQLPSDPNTQLLGFLVTPDGQTVGQESSVQTAAGAETMQLFQRQPMPGRWTFVIATLSPVGGTTTAGPFTGSVSLGAPAVDASGVPDSVRTSIPSGGQRTASVTVTNSGNTALNLFIDPRLTQRTYYSLLGLDQVTGVALPLSATVNPPLFAVPTETDVLLAAAQANAPINFDWGFDDPDLEGQSSGDTAAAQVSAPELTPGVWFLAPSLLGPFGAPASGTVNTGITAYSRIFDSSVTSSTGDPLLADVDATPPAAAPVTVAPGATATIPVTFAPTGRRRSVVTGDLFVDDYQAGDISANELAAIPYRYRVR